MDTLHVGGLLWGTCHLFLPMQWHSQLPTHRGRTRNQPRSPAPLSITGLGAGRSANILTDGMVKVGLGTRKKEIGKMGGGGGLNPPSFLI